MQINGSLFRKPLRSSLSHASLLSPRTTHHPHSRPWKKKKKTMNEIRLSSEVRRLPLFPKSFSLLRPKPRWWAQILDPGSVFVTRWNQIFLVSCMIALFLDPLYFYLPKIGGPACLKIDLHLGVIVTALRSVADLFHLMHVVLKFRTAYVARSSRVFGRGQLVMDGRRIAMRYLKSDFIVDFAAALPLPQIVIWLVIPAAMRTVDDNIHENHTLALIVLIQYVPRLIVIFPLNRRIIKTTGVVAKTAWSGAAYNLLLYLLASHVLGASWYLLAIERQHSCWKLECEKEMNATDFTACKAKFLYCSHENDPERIHWLNFSHLLTNCDAQTNDMYGMYSDAFTNEVGSSHFAEKYFYCLWWGLKNLSSYGQDLMTSTLKSETLFSIVICVGGLVLFSHLIGQMQNYLQSSSIRLEEWRVRRKDTEEWMRHRQLPPDLQERVRRFVQYKWLATRGVNEESILRALPLDIRREIQRHLCLALVRRVPFFLQMDDQLLDAICERLVSSLSTKDTYIVREGDPVNEMLFIIRGHLESSTTNGGRSGYFNSITLRSGDFCGEELLTWALMPNSTLNLPLSTRTVRSLTEVEAFALRADDLKFVANQFRRLHSKKLQHAFRYYSHQWRTWGACYIQTAWKRFRRRKLAEELAKQESYYYYTQSEDQDSNYNGEYMKANYEDSDGERSSMDNESNSQHLGATILASKFAANTKKGVNQKVKVVEPAATSLKKLFKPDEPDFFIDQEEG